MIAAEGVIVTNEGMTPNDLSMDNDLSVDRGLSTDPELSRGSGVQAGSETGAGSEPGAGSEAEAGSETGAGSEAKRYEGVKIGVLTSGGDAQGMNAVVRAVVRTAIQMGATPFAITEGWHGAIAGGSYIREAKWNDVSSILGKGGTAIGTARSDEFRSLEGQRVAVKNLIERGIDRLVIIGGDGTLTGANALRENWPMLVADLAEAGEISQEAAAAHSDLRIAGVVGSIDNDLVGTDMTIGADSALHRIIEAIDAIASTAASHQRTFIIEVMGRRCGYLALMSAIAGGCDYVFIPEFPPEDGWEDRMCEKLRDGRLRGRRDSLIIVAEGAADRHGNPITAQHIADVVSEKIGEDARITSLGHVQRGGTPSAYDRWMSTLIGYTASRDMVTATATTEPVIIGTKANQLVRLPLMESIEKTTKVKDYLADGDWDAAVGARGSSYRNMISLFETLSSPYTPERPAGTPEKPAGRSPRIGVLHAGGLAPGMNPAARAAVKIGVDRGYTMLGISGGFPGLIEGNIKELTWSDVEGWAVEGGAYLGTRRTIPTTEEFYSLGRAIETAELDGLIMIGGFKGYKAVYEMVSERDRYPAFNIPVVCVPASIDNNLPGAELSIGADTALNTNTTTIDAVKQSASASRRCFVIETMGRKSGYLALMSGIATGAEQIYIYEKGITLSQLADDTKRMVSSFKAGRQLYLVVKNEEASENYTADFLRRIFEEEGGGLFDVRSSIIGHAQQGGTPSPFDRTLAVQLVSAAMDTLTEQLEQGGTTSYHVGQVKGKLEVLPVSHMNELIDMDLRLPHESWWLGLEGVANVVSELNHEVPDEDLPIIAK